MSERLEHIHQVEVVKWARAKGLLIYRIHNGGKRTYAQTSYAIAEGELPGVPDLFLPVMRGGFGGLYIEMKRPEKGRVRETQKKIQPLLVAHGYRVENCFSDVDAIAVINDYLALADILPK